MKRFPKKNSYVIGIGIALKLRTLQKYPPLSLVAVIARVSGLLDWVDMAREGGGCFSVIGSFLFPEDDVDSMVVAGVLDVDDMVVVLKARSYEKSSLHMFGIRVGP